MNSQEAFNKTMHRLNYAAGIIKQYSHAVSEYAKQKEAIGSSSTVTRQRASKRKDKFGNLKEVTAIYKAAPILNRFLLGLKDYKTSFTLGIKALKKNEKLIPLFVKELNKNGIDPTFGKDLISNWEKLTPGAISADDLTAFSSKLNDAIEKLKAAAPAEWGQKAA